jgi:hypothetical protein
MGFGLDGGLRTQSLRFITSAPVGAGLLGRQRQDGAGGSLSDLVSESFAARAKGVTIFLPRWTEKLSRSRRRVRVCVVLYDVEYGPAEATGSSAFRCS